MDGLIATAGYDQKHAIIIGINGYKNTTDLEYAVNDAKAIREKLISKFGYEEKHMHTLIDDQATHQAIMETCYDLRNTTCINDSIVFFFAGHGITIDTKDKRKGFLVPYDGAEANLSSLISYESLLDAIEVVKAKHIFLIMDACYSGLALQRSISPSTRFLSDLTTRSVKQILVAGKSDQKVADSGGKNKHSIFTGALLEALDGKALDAKGILKASSVCQYVIESVGNNPRSHQTPSGGVIDGEGEFIFNYDEVIKQQQTNDGENTEIVVSLESPKRETIVEHNRNVATELEELLTSNNAFIKVDKFVNAKLKAYHIESKEIREAGLVHNVRAFQKVANDLFITVALLAYYGEENYVNQVKKILRHIVKDASFPEELPGLAKCYVAYTMLFICIIAASEAENWPFLESVLKIEDKSVESRYGDWLFQQIIDPVIHQSDWFSELFPEENYEFPLYEGIYKTIQPILEDIIFFGDAYEQKYITAELVIVLLYCALTYAGHDVWGPFGGRYRYKLRSLMVDIRTMPAKFIADHLHLYDDIDDIEEFYDKVNSFLKKYW